jgi:cytochrome d ubiquinol oxidase subunit I
MHFGAAVMVAAGTLFSVFWILAVNSWMQTPVGHTIVDGRFFPADWFGIIFSPSFPYRVAHTVTAFYITTALVVAGVAAYHLRAGRFREEGTTMLKMGFGLLTILVPVQMEIGDLHGLNTREHQPVKVAAIEANWQTQSRMPLLLFAWPDERAEANRFEIGIPVLGSVILTHDPDGIAGIRTGGPSPPPVAIPFLAPHHGRHGQQCRAPRAAGCGGAAARRRALVPETLRARPPLGFVAVIAGWVTTEVGRQPWVVYGLLRTGEAVTPSLTPGDVLVSLAVYVVAYAAIFGAGGYFLMSLLRAGPADRAATLEPHPVATPARPLSGAVEGE